MPKKPQCHYEFGPFRLDGEERVLRREGEIVPLTPKALETLFVLVERRGHLVERDDLIKEVWPDAFVEEGNLSVHISALRKALGEGPGQRSYIETVPRRGYRFTASVHEVDEDPDVIVEKRSLSRVVIEEEEIGEPEEIMRATPAPGPLPLARQIERRSRRSTIFIVVGVTLLAGCL